MIDRIFEMIMLEARKRPGKDIIKNAFHIMLELDAKIFIAFEFESKGDDWYPTKYTKTA